MALKFVRMFFACNGIHGVVQDSVLQLYDNSGRIAILSSTFNSLLKNSLQ